MKINLLIADSYYPVVIERENEEMARKAAKQVNYMVNQYRERFPREGLERILGMVAYHFSLSSLEQEDCNDTSPYMTKIKELTEVLEEIEE